MTPSLNPRHLPNLGKSTKHSRLADRMLSARQQLGWSQLEAARQLGFDDAIQLNRYEHGVRQPSKRRIEVIATVYGVSAGWLLYGEDLSQ